MLTNVNVPINSLLIGKTQNYLHHGPPDLKNAISEIQSMVILINQKKKKKKKGKFREEITLIKEHFMKASH